MEFKGTKGKWHSVEKNRCDYIFSDEGILIAEIDSHNTIGFINPTRTAIEANAKLIESAPEMFEMLKKIVLMTETCQGTFLDFRERYNIEINELITKITQ